MNKELVTSVVYLLDIVTSYVPAPLLRSKFTQILTSLAPALSHQDTEAPLVKSSIGCLESLLVAQDSAAWALPQDQISPRKGLLGLLTLATDHRPKVRKRVQDAISHVLKSPPPSPSLDHPAAGLCAESALQKIRDMAVPKGKKRKQDEHQPGLVHILQLVKSIVSSSGGWPSRKIEPLCEVLMEISRSNDEFLSMAVFEVFENMFAGMADEVSSSKLPRLMDIITELRPSQNDSQLLPPWIAVISRGYDVSAQVDPEGTFQKLPEIFELVSGFLSSSSHNIRESASECLISFFVTCIPNDVIIEPTSYNDMILKKLASLTTALLSIKYQGAWMEIFTVLAAAFEALKWKADVLHEVVKIVGELRGSESFQGKKEADAVLGKAIESLGPEFVLDILPLNLNNPAPEQPGRAWLLPILRDHVRNTDLAHFKSELVPLSEAIFQKIIDSGNAEKTMQIKIFETLVQQIWATLPGYCHLPMDLTDSFDKDFAELLANVLYKQTELRVPVCKALQMLVESNRDFLMFDDPELEMLLASRMDTKGAQTDLDHLSSFAGNLLAVLFNVYSQTLPQFRGFILQCINTYLSITDEEV